MDIRHNSDMVKNFAEIMLSKYYDKSVKSRSGFHRSDAISCPLKAYWRITKEIPPEYGTHDVGILLLGELAHIALHQNFEAQEKVYDLNGVFVTIDALYGKFPIETKTTRKQIYRKEDLLQSWIEQISIGMAVMGVNKGYLMVMNIINFALTVWEITMTDDERDIFLKACIWQIVSISDAILKKDNSLLTPKYDECEWCQFRPQRGKQGCKYYKPKPKEKKS